MIWNVTGEIQVESMNRDTMIEVWKNATNIKARNIGTNDQSTTMSDQKDPSMYHLLVRIVQMKICGRL